MKRRRFLRRTGAGLAGAAVLAGCTGTGDGDAGNGNGKAGTPSEAGDGSTETSTAGTTNTAGGTAGSGETTGTAGDSPSGTLTVATYSSFTGEGTAGNWLKSAFEETYPGTTVEFVTPDNGVNRYIQRRSQGAPIDADLYVGLNTDELVRADRELEEPLFRSVANRLDRADTVKDALRIDPEGRAIPYDTGYISLVYSEDEVDDPNSFDALLEPAYENALIAENAQQSDPGRAFLFWTIIAKGADGYLDYWQGLVDNGVQILADWEPAYQAYLDGEAPMVVSYSTDQVFYHGEDVDMSRHRIGFLNDQGYANPEAMALFEGTEQAALARRFVDFALTEEAQAEIAVRNVQFPAVEGVEPGAEFSKYALEPPEPVTMTYDELSGSVETWVEQWARQIAGG
ncbi:thiamine ABC transporter substrate-binding protein [Halobacteriales archaeon QS_4_69_34]|nr:MAG: thiamine ABC transporter substrate-binding protein [Halobacteriales archaeon QS_4_69_34]